MTQYDLDGDNDGLIDKSFTISNRAPDLEISKSVLVTVSPAGMLSITVHRYTSSGSAWNGFDLIDAPPDTTPPAAVQDLAVSGQTSTEVMLAWTAPTDDYEEPVASYDIRYSTASITEANWATASEVTGEPVPAVAGQPESFTVTDLSPNTTYYFAVKSTDVAGNVSAVSNIATGTTGLADTTPPAPIADLGLSLVDANDVTLTWTATGDDGTTGTATAYEIRYSTDPIDAGNWATATVVNNVPTPAVAGTAESTFVDGLTPNSKYYFAVQVADEAPNWSGLSNVVSATTLSPDVTAPSTIHDLSVVPVDSHRVQLTWTAPGDDGETGHAAVYDIRYSTSPIPDEAAFAAASQCTGEPAPQSFGTAEQFIAGNLECNTLYYFAAKAIDNGVPANVSAMSNVTSTETLDAIYGVSNGFSLDPNPAGPYDDAVPIIGPVSITNINVDQAGIVRKIDRAGPLYTGTIAYDVTVMAASVHVWLELSTDGGQTWSERRIQTIGDVGTIVPGTGKVAKWLVDGDHGNQCKIRIRVNDQPATYSNLDPDHNKMPRPVPWVHYPLLERMTDIKDYNFTDSEFELPKVDFLKVLSAGQVKAGFARVPFFTTTGEALYFMHCCYLESMDGQQRYVILTADTIYVNTDKWNGYCDQINAAFGIPEDNIMILYTHLHNSGNSVPGVEIFPLSVLRMAMNNAEPVEIGWFNKDMGTSYNVNRHLMASATFAYSPFNNNGGGDLPILPVLWEYDLTGKIVGALIDGAGYESPVQRYMDCPLDSYLQMLVFRNVESHEMKGILLKWTGHVGMGDYVGGLPRAVMDCMQERVGSNVEVMYANGAGSHHRQVAATHYDPVLYGSIRTGRDFAQALVDALPTMEFQPLTKMGMVMGYDTFGMPLDQTYRVGIDPDRLGVGLQAFRFNDIYLSTLPGETPTPQGFYVRARTSDLKHMYTGYGNTYYDYYSWGRWFDISHYERGTTPKRYDSYRMGQEIIRGIDILEQSVDALHYPGDINGDNCVNVGDLQSLVIAWSSSEGDPKWNPNADCNSDGYVNVGDLQALIFHWGDNWSF